MKDAFKEAKKLTEPEVVEDSDEESDEEMDADAKELATEVKSF